MLWDWSRKVTLRDLPRLAKRLVNGVTTELVLGGQLTASYFAEHRVLSLVDEHHIGFANGFFHVPNPLAIGQKKDGIACLYFHLLTAFWRVETMASNKMTKLRLPHLTPPHPR